MSICEQLCSREKIVAETYRDRETKRPGSVTTQCGSAGSNHSDWSPRYAMFTITIALLQNNASVKQNCSSL